MDRILENLLLANIKGHQLLLTLLPTGEEIGGHMLLLS
jgi:hypothetical protein